MNAILSTMGITISRFQFGKLTYCLYTNSALRRRERMESNQQTKFWRLQLYRLTTFPLLPLVMMLGFGPRMTAYETVELPLFYIIFNIAYSKTFVNVYKSAMLTYNVIFDYFITFISILQPHGESNSDSMLEKHLA